MPERAREDSIAVPRRPRGRPKKEREQLTPAMERALVHKRENPLLTLPEAAKLSGIRTSTAWKWKRYAAERPDFANFWRQWTHLDLANKGGPPDPGSFEDFRGDYLNVQTLNPYTGRTAWVGKTHDYMKPVVEALDDPDITRLLILLPVRFAKTTLAEQKCVHIYAGNPDAQVLFICSNLRPHLIERSYNIQRVLLDSQAYPELHEKWGPWIGKPEDPSKPWTRTSFYVKGRKSPERAPSFSGYGVTSKVYGARADWIFLDDIDDPGNGEEERASIMRAVNGPIASRLNPGGKIVYIGTRCGPTDVPSRLMNLKGWHTIVLSALNEDGESVCPEMYTTEELLEFRETHGEEMFTLMMLNDPVPEGSMMFPPDLVNVCKDNRESAPEDWDRYIALDPAPAGYAGLVVVARNRMTGDMLVIDAETRKGAGYDGMFDMLRHHVYKHRPRQVIVEEQGGSMWFTDVPEVYRFVYAEGASLVRFKTNSNKNDPRFGVSLIASKMAAGKLRLCWGDGARQRIKVLEDQMLHYIPGQKRKHGHNNDVLMALWFCLNVIASGARAPSQRRVMDPLSARRPWLTSGTNPQVERMKRELVVEGRVISG